MKKNKKIEKHPLTIIFNTIAILVLITSIIIGITYMESAGGIGTLIVTILIGLFISLLLYGFSEVIRLLNEIRNNI